MRYFLKKNDFYDCLIQKTYIYICTHITLKELLSGKARCTMCYQLFITGRGNQLFIKERGILLWSTPAPEPGMRHHLLSQLCDHFIIFTLCREVQACHTSRASDYVGYSLTV